jgi:hypothetical protein
MLLRLRLQALGLWLRRTVMAALLLKGLICPSLKQLTTCRLF